MRFAHHCLAGLLLGFAGGHASADRGNDCGVLPSPDSIHVLGEVTNPASLDSGGEPVPVRQVIAAANGLAQGAYTAGTILLRPVGIDRINAGAPSAQVATAWQIASGVGVASPVVQAIVAELLHGSRYVRIPVVADTSRLLTHPHLEPSLLPGDILIVPQRPNSVAITGHVAVAGVYAYEAGQDARAYVQQAGGFARGAQRSDSFAVSPDGALQTLKVEYWNYHPTSLLPGSVIYVPSRNDDKGLAASLKAQLNLDADGGCAR